MQTPGKEQARKEVSRMWKLRNALCGANPVFTTERRPFVGLKEACFDETTRLYMGRLEHHSAVFTFCTRVFSNCRSGIRSRKNPIEGGVLKSWDAARPVSGVTRVIIGQHRIWDRQEYY